jgi:hypothetical protein
MNTIIGIILIILLFIINWQIERVIKFTDKERDCQNTLYPVFSKAEILKQQARVDLSREYEGYQETKKEREMLNYMIEANIAVLNGAEIENVQMS